MLIYTLITLPPSRGGLQLRKSGGCDRFPSRYNVITMLISKHSTCWRSRIVLMIAFILSMSHGGASQPPYIEIRNVSTAATRKYAILVFATVLLLMYSLLGKEK